MLLLEAIVVWFLPMFIAFFNLLHDICNCSGIVIVNKLLYISLSQ